MIGIRRCVSTCRRRCSAGFLLKTAAASTSSHMDGYRAVNEPIYEYLKHSEERRELTEKIAEMSSQQHVVPIVIGDREMHTDDVKKQVMPFDHQRTLAKYSWADEKLLREAIRVSQEAHRAWRERPLADRARIMLRAADLASGKYRMELMAATMLGQAKTIVQAEIDAACELADFFRFDVQYAMDLTRWQPLSTGMSENKLIYRSCEGFWACIAPFNFTAISGHLVSAPLLMGNVALWKASDAALLSSYVVFKLLREAGVPPGVLNFVPSDGPLFGSVITKSSRLAGVNFTGSAKTFQFIWQEIAKNIHNYRDFPKLIGECGGKNFHLVHPSADVESVVSGTIRAAFEYSGQKCSACSRAYLPASLWPKVKVGLLEALSEVKLGSPLDADSFLSAVIDETAFQRLSGVLEHMRTSPNIDVIAGGHCDGSKGYFVEPTIVTVTDPTDRVMTEEFFGPLLAVYVYEDSDYDSVLKLIDESTAYSLTGAIYAEDKAVLRATTERLRFSTGNLYINDRCTGSVVCQQPFGGARKSGTNDKAGGPFYVMRFTSPLAVKTTHEPTCGWKYPYMQE